jgi:hypothetical protein
VYATQLDTRTLVFGSSGFLFRSNKLMYDRETNSLWHSLTGEPVVGPLAHSGIKLQILPVVVSTWGQWKSDHPDTKVLSLDTGYRREYVPGAAYGGYFASPDTMFPVWRRSTILPTKSFVFGLSINGTPKAYPLGTLERERVVNDTLGGEEIVLVAEPIGRTARAYRRGGHRFGLGPEDRTLIDERGTRWRVTEDALIEIAGAQTVLDRIAGHVSYWFGWYVFNPRTLVYGY